MYCCVADVGWITGHTYLVYGPLSNGTTSVMFESIPTYPNPYRRGKNIFLFFGFEILICNHMYVCMYVCMYCMYSYL